MTQLAINSRISKTIKKTLFFANFGKEFNLFKSLKADKMTQTVIKRVDILKQVHKNILQMQHRSTTYQNKKKKTMSQLKKGNKVYFLAINFRTKGSSKKLNHVKIEPFFIKKTRESVNYKLKFSLDIKIHSIFHVSLLKSVDLETSVQITFHFKTQEKTNSKLRKFCNKTIKIISHQRIFKNLLRILRTVNDGCRIFIDNRNPEIIRRDVMLF